MNARADTRAVRPMGVYTDMPFETYHAVDALSASALRVFSRSPWHLRNRVDVQQTRPMLRGSLVHCAQLEPNALAARYAFVPDGAPRRPTEAQWNAAKSNESSQAAKEWWRDFEARSSGREIITPQEYAICQQQLQAIQADPDLRELFSAGMGEVSIFWLDPRTRVYCKARLDWLRLNGNRARIGEVKSTRDESPSGFGRTAASMRYDLQRAHYVAAIKHGTRYEFEDFTFAAVTSAAPVLAVPYDLTDEMVEQSDDEREELISRYAWCVAENQWPAYGSGKQMLDFPAYAKRSGDVEVAFVEGEA